MDRRRQRARRQQPQRRTPSPSPTPPTYEERVAAGGPVGKRSPAERSVIICARYYHIRRGRPATPPPWFEKRFPVWPAYEFKEWELSLIRNEPYLSVLSKAHQHAVWLGREDGPELETEERETLDLTTKLLLSEFTWDWLTYRGNSEGEVARVVE